MQSVSAPDATTKHSRACEACCRAKAKCVPQSGVQSYQCARCFRLKKQCISPTPKPRKKREPHLAVKTAQLEQKIENLVTLLSGTQGSKPKAEFSAGSQSFLENPRDKIQVNLPIDFSRLNNIPPLNDPSWNVIPNHSCTTSHVPQDSTTVNLSTAEGSDSSDPDSQDKSEHLLQIFREQFAIHIPFFILSADETPQHLESTRPWLYRTMLMIACYEDQVRQEATSKQIGTDIALAMLLRGEKTLDMLQALLVYNAWVWYASSVHAPAMSKGYLQLSLALLFDLDMHRPVRDDNGGAIPQMERWNAESASIRDKRAIEERRALLFCFLLSSASCQYKKTAEGLRCTPYLDYSCQTILTTSQHESDIILGYSVKLHCFIEYANDNFANGSNVQRAPSWMHLTGAKTELETIWASIPLALRDNSFLQLSYRSAQVFLYESTLQKSTPSIPFNTHRLDTMYACLLSAQSVLDGYLALPIASYYGLSTINFAHIGHAIYTLFRLLFDEETGWDLAHVREKVDLPIYLDRFSSRFEQVGSAIDKFQRSGSKTCFPTKLVKQMIKVKGIYHAKLAGNSEQLSVQGQALYSESTVGDTFTGPGFECYLDDAYWESIMGDFMQP